MSKIITIIDYGIGNISSVANMIHKVGGTASICNDPAELYKASKIVLPGVGSFDQGMKNLYDRGWIDALNDAVLNRHIPILGICLGMQLMGNHSEEGVEKGLGWIDADVIKFRESSIDGLKVPHMGWNVVIPEKTNSLISSTEEHRFYFVHSYHWGCHSEVDILAKTDYGHYFTCAFQRGNIFGAQFHPEKSHRFGMGLFSSFLEI
ncbi:imidazole glycerol phosphate synthase subunit HisH [bacterium]|nr:imidazole glycerol phosphate synthase subunit HisH [bacterium]